MTVDEANEICAQMLPATLGIRFRELAPGRAVAWLEIGHEVMSPNGFLHGGTVIALADTACGFGTFATPGGPRTHFATIDLSCNFLGTAHAGPIEATATLVHGGRTTQVWDAEVTRDDGKRIAVCRVTQLLLDQSPAEVAR